MELQSFEKSYGNLLNSANWATGGPLVLQTAVPHRCLSYTQTHTIICCCDDDVCHECHHVRVSGDVTHFLYTRCAWAGGTCVNYPDFFENHQFHVIYCVTLAFVLFQRISDSQFMSWIHDFEE